MAGHPTLRLQTASVPGMPSVIPLNRMVLKLGEAPGV
jgi:hypothetical protein